MVDFSLVVPAKNEGRRIETTILSYISLLKKRYKNFEIIVVCNACTDNTSDIVQKLAKKHSQIKMLVFKDRIFKGGAVLEGLKVAKGNLLGFMDSDDPFNHDSILEMFDSLKHYDCVIASKWLNTSFSHIPEPFVKKILAIGWNMLARVFLGLHFSDTQAGAKFFSRKAYDAIDKNFICRSFDFDVELLYKFNNKKFSTKEVKVQTKISEFSSFYLKYVPKMFVNMLKLFLSR